MDEVDVVPESPRRLDDDEVDTEVFDRAIDTWCRILCHVLSKNMEKNDRLKSMFVLQKNLLPSPEWKLSYIHWLKNELRFGGDVAELMYWFQPAIWKLDDSQIVTILEIEQSSDLITELIFLCQTSYISLSVYDPLTYWHAFVSNSTHDDGLLSTV